jgi:hypothetical protein
MKRFVILFLLNVAIWKLVAQNNDFNSRDSLIVQSFEAKLTSTIIYPEEKFDQMCWPNNWYISSILLYNNELVTNKYLIYNGFENLFILLEPSKTLFSRLESDLVNEVNIKVKNSDSLLFRKMKSKQVLNGDSVDIFFNVLVEGKISLYVYRKIIWDNFTNGYVHDFQFYLKKQDEKLYHFTLKKSSFLAQFPDNKKVLKQIIKKNKLRIKNELDLAKAVRLLNSEM